MDPQTGLSLRGDELLIKAREAMIAAVHIFNGAGLTFRTELFIVTCIIAWTYLMHAWFRRERIDYRYKEAGAVKKTKHGAELYWELGYCLRHPKCPIPIGAVRNLDFLLELRHEIEHRSTNRIDDAVSAKLQACCINFNEAIRSLFGPQFGLEKRLPIALQFVTFDATQRSLLKKASSLLPHIETMMDAFHNSLSPEEQADQNFAYRVVFVPKLGTRASSSDLAVEFVNSDTDEARKINRVLLKEVDKRRYTATEVVNAMNQEGFVGFTMGRHIELWSWKQRTLPKASVALATIAIRGFGTIAGSLASAPIVRSTLTSTRPLLVNKRYPLGIGAQFPKEERQPVGRNKRSALRRTGTKVRGTLTPVKVRAASVRAAPCGPG